MRVLIVLIISLALAVPSFAGVYKWKDKNGKIHFTDDIFKVPADQRSKKLIRKMQSARKSSSNLQTAPVEANNVISHSPNTGIDKHRPEKVGRVVRFTEGDRSTEEEGHTGKACDREFVE